MLLGANTPWYRVRLTRGLGTSAASLASRSSGEILEGIGAAIEGWDSKVCPKGDELAEDFHELAKEVALAPKAKKLLSEARKQNPDANMYDAVKPLYVYDHEKDRWIKNKE